MEKVECPFCKELEKGYNDIIKRSRIIAETENFIVFPTTGGFIENYQLIVTKKHINCFGELSVNQLKELKNIILWQKEINKKYYNMQSLMSEHGALHPNNESGKSIVHAHLHIFPNNISLLDAISKYNFGIECIDDIADLRKICTKYESYLYYCDADNKNYIITHQGVPSQFLRKVLAESLGKNNWNWKEYPLIDEIEKNLEFYDKNSLVYKKIKEGE